MMKMKQVSRGRIIELREQREEILALMQSRTLPMNAERQLALRIVRLIETILDGEPSTPLPTGVNP